MYFMFLCLMVMGLCLFVYDSFVFTTFILDPIYSYIHYLLLKGLVMYFSVRFDQGLMDPGAFGKLGAKAMATV